MPCKDYGLCCSTVLFCTVSVLLQKGWSLLWLHGAASSAVASCHTMHRGPPVQYLCLKPHPAVEALLLLLSLMLLALAAVIVAQQNA
jgi:hypothetical protein